MIQETKGYKMKDLVNLSGVSKQTIHFYLREGLLLPPVRTSKNMAYYDESTVDDIRFIKALQEKRYLPLAVIKELLKAKHDGQDLLDDHLVLYEHLIGKISGGIASRQFDEASFIAESGITKHVLSQLIRIGIISHSPEAKSHQFDEFDLAVTEAIKELMAMGIRLQDIRLFSRLLQLARLETELIHDRIIHQDPAEMHKPLMDIYSKVERLKNLLTAKAYREFFANHRHKENGAKGEI